MKIRTRIFLGVLAVVGIGFYLFVRWIAIDLEPQYRKTTEEPLVDSARILASVAAATARGGQVDVAAFRRALADARSRPFSAAIFDHVKTGNADTIFDPGEVWVYTATGLAVDLSAPPAGVKVVQGGGCIGGCVAMVMIQHGYRDD